MLSSAVFPCDARRKLVQCKQKSFLSYPSKKGFLPPLKLLGLFLVRVCRDWLDQTEINWLEREKPNINIMVTYRAEIQKCWKLSSKIVLSGSSDVFGTDFVWFSSPDHPVSADLTRLVTLHWHLIDFNSRPISQKAAIRKTGVLFQGKSGLDSRNSFGK